MKTENSHLLDKVSKYRFQEFKNKFEEKFWERT